MGLYWGLRYRLCLSGYGCDDADAQCGEAHGYVIFQSFDFGDAHPFRRYDFVEGYGGAYCGLDVAYGYSVVVEGFGDSFLVFLLLLQVDTVCFYRDIAQEVESGHSVA